MKRRYGFTLIELLVVIAIIALIAAILFPVFASAREKARQTTCASNERQIGLALTQYSQDYDEAFPPCTENVAPLYLTWDTMLVGYTSIKATMGSNPLIFACPDDTVPAGPTERTMTRRTYAYAYPMQYPMNSSTSTHGVPLYDFNQPANILMVVEMPWEYNLLGWQHTALCWTPGKGASNQYGQEVGLKGDASGSPALAIGNPTTNVPLHAGLWNYLFVDGHVKALRPEDTLGHHSGCDTVTSFVSKPCGMWTTEPSLQ